MKVGVSSYSYWRYLASRELDIFDIIEMAARTGYEGIEFANLEYPENEKPEEFARSLRRACADAGLEICACAVGGNLANPDLDAELDSLKADIDFTSILGASVMRTDIMADFSDKYNTLKQCLERAETAIRQLAEYARGKGIVLTTENHGHLFCESSRLEQLISRVNHVNFRILADLGNFACADENSAYAIGRLAPWICHVHIKDFHIKDGCEMNPGEGWFASRGGNYLRGAIVGHGNIPVFKCIKTLQDKGYDGWLVVEFEGLEDPKQATKLGLENTRKMLVSL